MTSIWPIIGTLTALFVFFGGILVTVIRELLKSNQEHADKRFAAIEESHRTLRGDLDRRFEHLEREQHAQGDGLGRLRTDHSSLCSDLPKSYVARGLDQIFHHHRRQARRAPPGGRRERAPRARRDPPRHCPLSHEQP